MERQDEDEMDEEKEKKIVSQPQSKAFWCRNTWFLNEWHKFI